VRALCDAASVVAAEIAALCPNLSALFLPTDCKVTDAGLAAMRQSCPGVRVSVLGRQLSREQLLSLLRSYCQTRQLNLGSKSGTRNLWAHEHLDLTDAGLAELAALCPNVEAVFTQPGSQITRQGLQAMKAACPVALCVQLGHEIDESAFEMLRTQYRDHRVLDLSDAALFGRITLAGLAELPQLFPDVEAIFSTLASPGAVDMQQLQELKDPCTCPKLWCLYLGRAIDFAAYQALLGQCSSGRVDLQGPEFAAVDAAGLMEIAQHCPELEAIFTERNQSIFDIRTAIKAKCPSCRCAILGQEITAQMYSQLEQQFKATGMLDLTVAGCEGISDTGLAELVLIPGACSGLESICVKASGSRITAAGLEELQGTCPKAHVVMVSADAVSFDVQKAAIDAKAELERHKEALRQSVLGASGAAIGYKSSQEPEPEPDLEEECTVHACEVARQKFVDASNALSRAMAESGPLAAAQAVVAHAALWQDARSIEQQLSLGAAECAHMIAQSEPERSTAALQELHEKEEVLRGKAQACFHRLRLAEQEAASPSPRRVSDGAELQRTSTTPEQQAARAALLARPMQDWSEEQVQEWISVIGLPVEQVELVQRVLADEETDGDELQNMRERWLFRKLQKAGATDAAGLAKQTMALHEGAQGAAPAEDKLMAAQAALDTTRAELRQTTTQLRSQVVHLVALSSQHFPELLGHEDVRKFMSTDGLQAPDHRQLADYEDVRPLTTGRNEVLLAKYDGVDVCLKRFAVQGDMRTYTREVLRVQRLQHPFIIHYTTAFEDNGSMYLEMEYFAHGSLRRWLETTKPDLAKIRSLLRQVLLALACMHSQNIVHCDIKPENVLVANDETPRICDFEMSKDLGAALSSTMAGGTVLFMAPEVRNHRSKPSTASDMYAFGLLMLNTVCEFSPGDTYPRTDTSTVVEPALKDLITRLLSEHPPSRPSAVQLQAEPYFADDGMAEVTQQLQHAQQAITQVQEQVAEAKSDAERRLAQQAQQAAMTRAAEAARLKQEADARVKEARDAEQRDITLREADAALEQGVRWLCEGSPYAVEIARVLEQEFQRMRLFPTDGRADSVNVRVRRVRYRVSVSADGVGMMQCRPDTGTQRPVRREEALLAPLCTTTTPLEQGCEPWMMIQDRIQESLPQHVVTRLVEIDNNQLLVDFERQKEIVAAKDTNAARGGTVDMANVRVGFHAMAGGPNELKKIYEGGRADGGFDYRLGRGGAYGRGSYFAEHAIYSAYLYPCPTKAADGSIVLLVAEVILGQSKDLGQLCSRDLQPWDPLGTARICDLVREPPIEGGATGEVYDSVQGTERSFGIHDATARSHPRRDARQYGRNPQGEEEYGRQYILYDKARAYPRYLVTIRPQ
jgi:hypothetical protein